MTEWTKQNSTAARAQGWDVVAKGDDQGILEICRDEPSKIFLTDEAAREYVKAKAAADSLDSIWAKAQMVATQRRN